MKAKDAVKKALDFVEELFGEDDITNLGLEEVDFEQASEQWAITVGFSRPWDYSRSVLASMAQPGPTRSFKVVRISDSDGEVISVKNREGQ